MDIPSNLVIVDTLTEGHGVYVNMRMNSGYP